MSHSSEETADIAKGSIPEAAFEERVLRLTKRMAHQVPLRLKNRLARRHLALRKEELFEKKWMLKHKLEGGDEGKIEAAVQ